MTSHGAQRLPTQKTPTAVGLGMIDMPRPSASPAVAPITRAPFCVHRDAGSRRSAGRVMSSPYRVPFRGQPARLGGGSLPQMRFLRAILTLDQVDLGEGPCGK